MSLAYDTYLKEHKQNVKRGYDWFKDFLPELITTAGDGLQYLIDNHDYSKNNADEYAAYDNYFYGGNKSYDVKTAFDFAWLLHIHRNPHHWQFWVLQGDDDGVTPLEMPYEYVIEMICDWWSFSWGAGNLLLIFDWYNDHKNSMLLNPKTKIIVESILSRLKTKLDEEFIGTQK